MYIHNMVSAIFMQETQLIIEWMNEWTSERKCILKCTIATMVNNLCIAFYFHFILFYVFFFQNFMHSIRFVPCTNTMPIPYFILILLVGWRDFHIYVILEFKQSRKNALCPFLFHFCSLSAHICCFRSEWIGDFRCCSMFICTRRTKW